MSRMWVTMPLVLAINAFVDFSNPLILTLVRGAYILIAGLTWLAYNHIQTQVEANKASGDRTVWVKPAAAPNLMNMVFGAAPDSEPSVPAAAYSKTTLCSIEAERAAKGTQQAVMNTLINMFFSFQMGIQLPITLQLIQGPMALFEDDLVRKYVLGMATPALHKDVLYHDPASTPAPRSEAIAAGSGAPAAAAVAAGDVACEEAVFQTWESREPVDAAPFEALVAAGKDINYQTAAAGWSVLMVMCGSPYASGKVINTLLELGAKLDLVDADGWNAAHWAAFHGCRAPVDALIAACARGGADLRDIFQHKNAEGKTPADVATAAGHAALAQRIRDAVGVPSIRGPATEAASPAAGHHSSDAAADASSGSGARAENDAEE